MGIKLTPPSPGMSVRHIFQEGALNFTLGLVLSTYGMATIIGSSYALLGLATLLSPLFIGMVADRFFSSKNVMAILHLIIDGLLFVVPQFLEARKTGLVLISSYLIVLLCDHI
ncbi:MFS transporter, partial [Escherichia coli]|nr:MFS transporter [Escherichia coli]